MGPTGCLTGAAGGGARRASPGGDPTRGRKRRPPSLALRAAPLLALTIALWPPWPGADAAPPAAALLPIDRIELVVEGEALTTSEFIEQGRVLVAWQQPQWDAREPFSEALTVKVRDYIIDAMLIAAQARRIGVGEESEEALLEAEWQLLASRPDLAELGPLRPLLRRSRRNDRYLAQRLVFRQGARGAPTTHALGQHSPGQAAWLLELRRAARIRVVAASGLLEPVVVRADSPP